MGRRADEKAAGRRSQWCTDEGGVEVLEARLRVAAVERGKVGCFRRRR